MYMTVIDRHPLCSCQEFRLELKAADYTALLAALPLKPCMLHSGIEIRRAPGILSCA